MTTYIGVTAKNEREHELDAYLYNGVTHQSRHSTYVGGVALNVYKTEDSILAQQQADRFSSGMFGARVLDDEEAARAYIVDMCV